MRVAALLIALLAACAAVQAAAPLEKAADEVDRLIQEKAAATAGAKTALANREAECTERQAALVKELSPAKDEAAKIRAELEETEHTIEVSEARIFSYGKQLEKLAAELKDKQASLTRLLDERQARLTLAQTNRAQLSEVTLIVSRMLTMLGGAQRAATQPSAASQAEEEVVIGGEGDVAGDALLQLAARSQLSELKAALPAARGLPGLLSRLQQLLLSSKSRDAEAEAKDARETKEEATVLRGQAKLVRDAIVALRVEVSRVKNETAPLRHEVQLQRLQLQQRERRVQLARDELARVKAGCSSDRSALSLEADILAKQEDDLRRLHDMLRARIAALRGAAPAEADDSAAADSVAPPLQTGRTAFPSWNAGTPCQVVQFPLPYGEGDVHVLATVNHLNEQDSEPHDAIVAWVEDVNAFRFRLCVAETAQHEGSRDNALFIDWLAFQQPPEATAAGVADLPADWSGDDQCIDVKYAEALSAVPTIVVNVVHPDGAAAATHAPATTWVEDKTDTGFRVCVSQLGALTDTHDKAAIAWLAYVQPAVPQGGEAGAVPVLSWTSPVHCEAVRFRQQFAHLPRVYASITHPGSSMRHRAATVWLERVTLESFMLCVADTVPDDETHDNHLTVDYLALPPGK